MKKILTSFIIVCAVLPAISSADPISQDSEIEGFVHSLYAIEDPVQRLRDIKFNLYEISDLKLRVKFMRNMISFWLAVKRWELSVPDWVTAFSREENQAEDDAESLESDEKESESKVSQKKLFRFWPYTRSKALQVWPTWKYMFMYKYDDWKWIFESDSWTWSLYDENSIITNWSHYIYKDKTDEWWIVNISWKKMWPYESVDVEWSIIQKSWKYALKFWRDTEDYLDINWTEYWPFREIKPEFVQITDDWGFTFIVEDQNEEESKWIININWKEYWPYEKADSYIANGWKFIYSYSVDDEWDSFINLNWKNYGPYSAAEIIWINQKWSYSYKHLKDQKWVLNRNWEEVSWYDYIAWMYTDNWSLFLYYSKDWDVFVEDSSWKVNWPFRYFWVSDIDAKNNWNHIFIVEKSQWDYVNASWEELWPFKKIENLSVSEDWSYAFSIIEDQRLYAYINWKRMWPFNDEFSAAMSTNWNYMFSYWINTQSIVKIIK